MNSPLPKPQIPFTGTNILIVLLCIAVVGITFVDNLHGSYIKTRAYKYTSYGLESLGLWQRWDMFAGGVLNVRVRYRYSYEDGTQETVLSAINNKAPLFPSVYTNFDYSVATQQDKRYAQSLLRYYCTKPRSGGKYPTTITMEYAQASVPTLLDTSGMPDPRSVNPIYSTVVSQSCLTR